MYLFPHLFPLAPELNRSGCRSRRWRWPGFRAISSAGVKNGDADINKKPTPDDHFIPSPHCCETHAAIGTHALAENTTGNDNTAIGDYPLWQNTTGRLNVAIGTYALSGNITGKSNTAIGTYALNFVNGDYNIGVGFGGGANLTNGDYNIAIGNRGVAGEATPFASGRQ